MRIARYRQEGGTTLKIEYDENAPCIICGEPVIGASMGGTVICPSCDCGKCRYCGTTICVVREEIDGGRSKQRVLDHMKWHHKYNPELVKKINTANTKMMDMLDKEAEEREKEVKTK